MKEESAELPASPSFYEDPTLKQAKTQLLGLGGGLTSSTVEGLPSILQPTVQLSPDITRLSIENMKGLLAPELRRSREDIISQLEANNQLTGSTTASSLSNLESDYLSRLEASGAQAAIADVNRALQNRIGLYGTGLSTIESAGRLGATSQEQRNQFNLSNYENEVARTLYAQKQQKGGFMGALTGAIGGGLAGFSMGGPVGAAIGAGAGGLGGYFGPSGTGGGIMQAGAGLYGSKLPTKSSSLYGGEAIDDLLKQRVPQFSMAGGLAG